MTTPTQTSLNLADMLSPAELEELFALAEEQKRPLKNVVQIAIENYIVGWHAATREPAPDFEEDSDEDIIASFMQGWHEAMTGQVVDGFQALDEIRQELEDENARED